jgi:hypothetical protein
MKAISFLFVVAATSLWPGAAKAELPPFAYRDMQAKAPEAIEIEIETVTVKSSKQQHYELRSFVVQARVLSVQRTATGLAPGKPIEIRYEQRNYFEPITGASEVPAVKEHEKLPAFLSRANGQSYYTPAAGGYTFHRLPRAITW